MEEKNSNKGLIICLIICIIIILVLTGLLVWKFIDKDSNNENTPVDTNEKQEETVSYDLEDAKELIDKYVGYDGGAMVFSQYFENGYNNAAKAYLAISQLPNTKFNTVNCKSIYSDNKDVIYSDDQGYLIESLNAACSRVTTTSVPYDTLNDIYKELFGSNEVLSKEDVSFSFFRYDYDEKTNQFILLQFQGGGADTTHYGYGIKSANKTGNTLVIDVGYYSLEPNDDFIYSSTKTDKTYTEDEIYRDTFDTEFFNEFKDKIDTYRFTFEYETDHYVLIDMKKN